MNLYFTISPKKDLGSRSYWKLVMQSFLVTSVGGKFTSPETGSAFGTSSRQWGASLLTAHC